MMLSFLKRKISAIEVASFLNDSIQKNAVSGYKDHPLPVGNGVLSNELIIQEWLYLAVFTTDFSISSLFQDKPETKAILSPFWARIREWLTNIQVPALPVRGVMALQWKLAGPDRMIWISEENQETAYDRAKRRAILYAQAVRTPPPLGFNDGVSRLFIAACGGDSDFNLSLKVGGCFHGQMMSIAETLKAYRVTIP